MNKKLILTMVVGGFVAFCGLLVFESGLFANSAATRNVPCILLQQTTVSGQAVDTADKEKTRIQAVTPAGFYADPGEAASLTLGSVDPDLEFNFEIKLTSRGAAIRTATFSGFDDRDYEDPQPLVILSPVGNVLSMANRQLVFVDQELQLRLHDLHWQSLAIEPGLDGSQTAVFEVVIKDSLTNEPVLKLNKTYKVVPNSYLLHCKLTVENLSQAEKKIRLNLNGPVGIGREGFRSDMRKTVAGFVNAEGQIISARLDCGKLRKAGNRKEIDSKETRKIKPGFLWAAAVNKYFAAIVVPAANENKGYCDWVTNRIGRYYNPDGDKKGNTGDETVGVDLKIATSVLQSRSSRTYNFSLYLGPKDKRLFDKNEMYKDLGFVHTIDFMGCCCPDAIIHPLAFGILAAMEWLHEFIPNYGVVIIILVFIVRIVLHPLSKKSQISMSKFSKVLSAPEVQEIRKKYAKNKTEMNRRIMAFQKERGMSPATPIMGMLPMFLQMPILIALWSAIYASIALRGEPFLPVWITDLSAPDALVRFSPITVPLLGSKIQSFNLLPVLMGIAMYMQQKLMPKQPAATPQAAQQQKMMMIMMPLFLPLILYNGPSGVNLYFMASTFAGVLEQHFIRKHIREAEQAEASGLVAVTSKTGGKVKKKKPKPFHRKF